MFRVLSLCEGSHPSVGAWARDDSTLKGGCWRIMSEFLYYYHAVEPATWFYLSSLLMIGLLFKFSRFWSVRNLDLVLLIFLMPGLLFVHYGRQLQRQEASVIRPQAVEAAASGGDHATTSAAAAGGPTTGAVSAPADLPNAAAAEPPPASVPTAIDASDDGVPLSRAQRVQRYGYLWLFCGGVVWALRLLADPTMVRRPLLEPNLSAGGLTFIGCSLFVFLMANVISRPSHDMWATRSAVEVAASAAAPSAADAAGMRTSPREGPGYALLGRLSTGVQKALAIVAHLAIVLGMVLIGYWHFDNIVMGIGAATLYLMMPYTALMTNQVTHALPGAFLVWAVLCYRKPWVSGILLGAAGGVTYYPLFLLPLWISFYWQRGMLRFIGGVAVMLVILMFVLFSSHDVVQNIRTMFGLLPPAMKDLGGIWDPQLSGWSAYYRIPLLVAFVALASSMALWPAQKNLGTLLSCSAALLVATQLWHGYSGGTNMAWYLPLLLLTMFRPNLEDRVALTVLSEGWLPRRSGSRPSGQAS